MDKNTSMKSERWEYDFNNEENILVKWSYDKEGNKNNKTIFELKDDRIIQKVYSQKGLMMTYYYEFNNKGLLVNQKTDLGGRDNLIFYKPIYGKNKQIKEIMSGLEGLSSNVNYYIYHNNNQNEHTITFKKEKKSKYNHYEIKYIDDFVREVIVYTNNIKKDEKYSFTLKGDEKFEKIVYEYTYLFD